MNQDLSCQQCGNLLDKKYIYLKNEQLKQIKLISQDHRYQINIPKLKLIQYDQKLIGEFPQFIKALDQITIQLNIDLMNLKNKFKANIVEFKELRKQAKSISEAYENIHHITVTEVEMEIQKMIEQFQKVFEIQDFKTAYERISTDSYSNLKIDLTSKFVASMLEQ